MLGALGVSGDESPTKADGYCILDDCALDVSSGGGARTAKYALSTSQASGDIAVVFLPLGVSRLFVTREDVAESARDAGLRLLAVDRPGVGGTQSGVSDVDTRSMDGRSNDGVLRGSSRMISTESCRVIASPPSER